MTTEYEVHWQRGKDGRAELREGAAPAKAATASSLPPPPPVPARVARLVALAHHLEGLVRGGRVADYAKVAAVARLTRARVSQITDLLNLAPDIQEQLLVMTKPTSGRERLGERDLRAVVRQMDWNKQRSVFADLQRGHLVG